MKQRDLWRAQNIVNYSYVLEQKTGTSTALRWKLTVKAGVVVAGINLANNRTLSSRDLKAQCKTIEQVFSSIEAAITNKYAVINASYEASLGYPTSALLDKSTSTNRDDVSLKASGVTKL